MSGQVPANFNKQGHLAIEDLSTFIQIAQFLYMYHKGDMEKNVNYQEITADTNIIK
jgi:hypothetical protein